MKNLKRVSVSLLIVVAIALPAIAQEERPPVTAETGGRGGLSAGSSPSPGPSISSRGISVGSTSGGTVSSASRDMGPSFSSAGTGTTGGSFAPNLQGTSFYSVNSYYQWQDYLWRLRTRYMLDMMYFARFYRNREPLVTPHLMKLTLREPLSLSSRMLLAVEELENLLADHQAGKPFNRNEIISKANQIRDYAKKIRSDESLSFVDRRPDINLAKVNQYDKLGLHAISQLRELVNDLHSQLKGMYTQKETSTISVHTLTQPSFESMSKGIEKLSRIIEGSAKRL